LPIHSSNYLVLMGTLLAGVIGALVGLLGVGTGAWLQGRKEHQRWLRDQKLRAAVDFIGATGDIYDRRRQPRRRRDSAEDSAQWARAQDARSALYLLCESTTVHAAEVLIQRVRQVEPRADGSHDSEIITLLQDLVRRLRQELGAGRG
jgi:hypothetical protein